MITCLGKSCSFGLPRVLSIYVLTYFPFGFEGRMMDLIVSVTDHCLSFYFPLFQCFLKSLRVTGLSRDADK